MTVGWSSFPAPIPAAGGVRGSCRSTPGEWRGGAPAAPGAGCALPRSVHSSAGAGGMRLGLRQEGTRRVVDVEECLQLSERMNRAARALREALGDRTALWPGLRGLDLLESPDGGTLLAALGARAA